MRTRSNTLAIAALMLALLAGAGCGSDDDSDRTTAASAGERTLTVAVDATYPPNEFLGPDGKTVMGMSADLGEAIGEAMGVRLEFVNAPFDGILPGLASGKYDIGFSSFTDTEEREKTVDFVTYYSAGTSFFVRAEDGPQIGTLADLCGRTVAVQKGTVQADYAARQADKCKSSGKPTLKVLVLPDQPAANLALSSGRADVSMADSPVAAYRVKKSDGGLKLMGKPFGTAPYGIAVPKGSDLTKPLLRAVQSIMRDGSYDAVLRKWGVQVGAIDNPTVNGAID